MGKSWRIPERELAKLEDVGGGAQAKTAEGSMSRALPHRELAIKARRC
jgi:hypothetical protein